MRLRRHRSGEGRRRLHPETSGRLVQKRAALVPCTPLGRHRTARPLRHRDRRAPRGRHRPQRHRRQADGAAAAAPARHGHDLPLADRGSAAVCASRPTSWWRRSAAPAFVTPDFVKPGATVIDVGINRVDDAAARRRAVPPGQPAACRFREARLAGGRRRPPGGGEVAGALTPVPGGVGPLTIAMLLKNTVREGALAEARDAQGCADRRHRDRQELRASPHRVRRGADARRRRDSRTAVRARDAEASRAIVARFGPGDVAGRRGRRPPEAGRARVRATRRPGESSRPSCTRASTTAIDRWIVGAGCTRRRMGRSAEIPLLFETGHEGDFDRVIVVACAPRRAGASRRRARRHDRRPRRAPGSRPSGRSRRRPRVRPT